jgi:hypothetical protein
MVAAFYGARDLPAWHRKGIVDNLQHTALDAFDLIGRYDVDKLQLQTIITKQDGSHIEVPAYGLIRRPMAGDPHEAYFGTVSDQYRLVTPEEFCRMWDERTRKAVETMIALKGGRQFVITSRLGEFAVKDDVIENYLQAYMYMDGSSAAGTLTSNVRMVCANTVAMAISASHDHQRFVHDAFILDRMSRWLEDVIQRAEAHLPELQQAFEVLSEHRLGRSNANAAKEIRSVIHAAYPPVPPFEADPLLTDDMNEARAKKQAAQVKIVDKRRVQVLDLFKGEGRGMRNDATWGTMWGLVQAVNELEDWKGGSGGAGLAHSILFGERAETKARAITQALHIATGSSVD